jgi:apolipoprotein N-acyltransferase
MKNKNLNLLWLTLYAALTFFAIGRWQFPAAAWFASIFALRFYRQSDSVKSAFFLLWAASAIPTIFAWRNATAMHYMGGFVEPIFFAIATLLGMIPFVMDRRLHRRWASAEVSPFWLTLVYPISAAALDFFSGSGSPFGTFGAAGYTQTGFTAIMQIASITGLWSIPFIVGWFGSFINYLWENDLLWTKIRFATWIYAGFMILILGFGFGRILSAPAPQQEVMIAGFSLPENGLHEIMTLANGDDKAAFHAAANDLNIRQLDHVRELAQQGAEIISLQEGAAVGYPEDIESLLADAGQLTQEENIYLVLPTVTIDPTGEKAFKNIVQVIDPNGDVVLEHVKYGGSQFEGSLEGSGEIQTVDTPYGKLSAVICWDADFPATIKQAGTQDVALLFIPSNDWYEVRDIHNDMSTFRAVENGMSIFRQTGAGVSSVTDAYGRVISRTDMFEMEKQNEWSNEQMVLTPIGSVQTAFPQVGDSFGLLMLVSFAGLIIFSWVKRK